MASMLCFLLNIEYSIASNFVETADILLFTTQTLWSIINQRYSEDVLRSGSRQNFSLCQQQQSFLSPPWRSQPLTKFCLFQLRWIVALFLRSLSDQAVPRTVQVRYALSALYCVSRSEHTEAGSSEVGLGRMVAFQVTGRASNREQSRRTCAIFPNWKTRRLNGGDYFRRKKERASARVRENRQEPTGQLPKMLRKFFG